MIHNKYALGIRKSANIKATILHWSAIIAKVLGY